MSPILTIIIFRYFSNLEILSVSAQRIILHINTQNEFEPGSNKS